MELQPRNNIVLIHAYGQTTFNDEEIRAYGSLESLMASDILAGIPNREKSVRQLWEAAQSIAYPTGTPDPEEQETAEEV